MRVFLKTLVNQMKIWLFMLLLLIPMHLLALPIILILLVVRALVWILAKVFRPDLHAFVTGEHAVFAYESSSKAAANILIKTVWESDLGLVEFRKDFQHKIFDSPQNGLLYSGLQNTWTSFLGYAFWKKDTNFDLEHHVREYDYGGRFAIPSPCTEKDIHSVLGGLAEAPWNRKRSPWEMLLVPNYELNGKLHTTILFRIDHALCDGYSLVQLCEKVVGTPFSLPKINLGNQHLSRWARLCWVFKVPYDASKNAVLMFCSSKLQHRKMSAEEAVVSVYPSIDVETIKTIKDHFRVNFAAVVYSAILGGIERCLKSSGQEVPPKIALVFVVPKPKHPGGLCVHAAMITSKWPLISNTSEDRLLKIQRDLLSLSQSTAPVWATFIARTAAYFPMGVRRMSMKLVAELGLSAGITSFPVTTGPVYYKGHEMVELMGCVGRWSNMGLACVSGGVNNKLRLCAIIDKSVFASEDAAREFGNFVNEELQALFQATV